MQTDMIKRLRKRFIHITMAAVTLVLLLLSLIVNLANFWSVDSGLKEMLRTIYENQGKIPPALPNLEKGEKPEGGFTPETPFMTRFFVLRYTTGGELVQADLDHIAAVTEETVGEYLEIAVNSKAGFGYASGYRYYSVFDGENRRMTIFLDCHQEVRNILKIAVLSLAAIAICIFLVYLIVVWLSRRAIDPVVKASEQQKQFITDAGHELKTPITVIATSLKILEMENGKQKWIEKAQAQTEKLKELVNSLVTLSKMDEENPPFVYKEFCVSDTVRETADSFTDFASSQGYRLCLQIEPQLFYKGDEYAIRQLISILLDNAVKYALPGTDIRISLEKNRKNRKGFVLRLENVCREKLTVDPNRLFDRFYRPDPARGSQGGFGIGLSIARSIVQGHKGSIHAEILSENRILFTAELS